MRLLYSIILCCSSILGMSQQFNGILLDQSGHAIDYGNIFVKNSELHTHSDKDGKFKLEKIKLGDTIEVSHISYISQTLIISKDNIDIINKMTLVEREIALSQILITPETRSAKSLALFDLSINPTNNAQELLRIVPGLIIGQHAGGGKAEQIFLRGFDIDHGTDINISMDGMPINMVSHAHGQGYADMHFLIPETIDQIEYGKGPYETDKGNLATAGSISFKTKDRLDNSLISIETGSFNTQRALAMLSLINTNEESAYISSELLLSDGPFESKQAFNRMNLFGKYTKNYASNDKLSISLSRFSSRWDASGQIPIRAVESGLINRFGAIDNTEGGQTSRINLILSYNKYISETQFLKNKLFFSHYDFLLFSNFTFFLNDPINGDQIRQKEQRYIAGLESEYNQSFKLGSASANYRIGFGFRNDDVNDISLDHTLGRKTVLISLSNGQINETNVYTYFEVEFRYNRWFVNTGLRLDYFNFIYEDQILPNYIQKAASKALLSPKVNIQYTINNKTQLFLRLGQGFHSNDTRVVTANNDYKPLPKASGLDIGIEYKAFKNLYINASLWVLSSQQEFVYVGDEAIVELSGESTRKGVDLGIRYQLFKGLFIYNDLNLAHARKKNGEELEFIPLAPSLTNTGGISYKSGQNWAGGLRYRHISDRPANEDNSIVAIGYTVVDANIQYNFKKISLGIDVNNLLNTKWNETQFATESRLKNETQSVEEIHFTPGAPISVRFKLGYKF